MARYVVRTTSVPLGSARLLVEHDDDLATISAALVADGYLLVTDVMDLPNWPHGPMALLAANVISITEA